jgi:hypothetical protein
MSGKSPKWFARIAALLVFATLAWWWLRKTPPADPGATVSATNDLSRIATSTPAAPSKTSVEQGLQSAANALAAARTVEERSQALSRLRQALATGSTNEVTAAIRSLLDTKLDTPTGQGFKIVGGGSLQEAPTLRTWLLDQLATLDPAAGAAYARVILETSTSPDEWAIALRNLARGDTSSEARTLLATKTAELLRNEAWQQGPSVGYLEAFDTAVHLGGTSLLPPLTDLVSKKDNPAVAHAAFLTLDRLIINQPAKTLAALNEHPDWMQGREETRANYFARANVGDAEQRRIIEAYLLDATRSPAEVQTFAGIFPNANFMISHNLLTENATLDNATLRRRDQASLEVVTQWLADPRFEKLQQPLAKIQSRLREFTKQTR